MRLPIVWPIDCVVIFDTCNTNAPVSSPSCPCLFVIPPADSTVQHCKSRAQIQYSFLSALCAPPGRMEQVSVRWLCGGGQTIDGYEQIQPAETPKGQTCWMLWSVNAVEFCVRFSTPPVHSDEEGWIPLSCWTIFLCQAASDMASSPSPNLPNVTKSRSPKQGWRSARVKEDWRSEEHKEPELMWAFHLNSLALLHGSTALPP